MSKAIIFLSVLLGINTFSQDFTILPLGVRGGLEENNLSSYLISESGSEDYFCLDAGTLRSGLQKAFDHKIISKQPAIFLKQNIKGYFISHPHFDHSSGLIINSPADNQKKIYGFPFTINAFKKDVFNNETWGNFGNEGEKSINTYQYQQIEEGKEYKLENTPFSARFFVISHMEPFKSSAILLKNLKNKYFLYLGDTGADRIEKTSNLEKLWSTIAPLIQNEVLKGIAIECSFSDEQPEDKLFGHLTPKLLIEEMQNLSKKVGNKDKTGKISVIITHIKPKDGIVEKIEQQLEPLKKLNIKFQIANQSQIINL